MLGPEYSRGTGVGEGVNQRLWTCKICTQAESSARSVAQNEALVCSSVVCYYFRGYGNSIIYLWHRMKHSVLALWFGYYFRRLAILLTIPSLMMCMSMNPSKLRTGQEWLALQGSHVSSLVPERLSFPTGLPLGSSPGNEAPLGRICEHLGLVISGVAQVCHERVWWI